MFPELLVVPALAVGLVAAAGFLSAGFASGHPLAGTLAGDDVRAVVGEPGLHGGQPEGETEEEDDFFHR